MFIATTASRFAIVAQYPSAAKIVKVDGGYMIFETLTDYQTWLKQK